MSRVLHLVLFSEADHYVKMYQSTKTWYKQFEPNVKTLYYFRDASITEPIIDEEKQFLRVPGVESYISGILDKTIQAFEYFFDKKAYAFDFVVRSNISTVVNFPHLLPLLQSCLQNRNFLFGSTLCSVLTPVSDTTKLICDEHPGLKFAHGTCLLFHPSTISYLLSKKELLHKGVEDDVSFSLLFTQTQQEHKGVFLPRQMGLQYAGLNLTYNLDNVSAFRNHNFNSDRSVDVTNVGRATAALQKRYDLRTKPSIPISKVTYGDTMDITKYIVVLCKAGGTWQSDGNNNTLDFLFNDPQPNTPKVLQITFNDSTVFAQNATLTFFLQNKDQLCVK